MENLKIPEKAIQFGSRGEEITIPCKTGRVLYK
jgi:hypothetical protein